MIHSNTKVKISLNTGDEYQSTIGRLRKRLPSAFMEILISKGKASNENGEYKIMRNES